MPGLLGTRSLARRGRRASRRRRPVAAPGQAERRSVVMAVRPRRAHALALHSDRRRMSCCNGRRRLNSGRRLRRRITARHGPDQVTRVGKADQNGPSRPASGPGVRVARLPSGRRPSTRGGHGNPGGGGVDPVRAADGAVTLMERLWPALEQIDTSSGMLGTAVNKAIDELIPLLIAAPADQKLRAKWLERLYQAVLDDGVQYLWQVEARWGRSPIILHCGTTTSTSSCRCCDEFGLTAGLVAMSSARTFACRHCWRRGDMRTSWRSWR